MTSLRQSASTTHTSSHYNNHNDNLDLLLEDLQTTVSRPGSSLAMNSPLTSGYREVTRTVTNQGMNGPETSTEYQIEYLNPANKTTVIAERGASPNLDILTDTKDLPPGSRKVASYKEVSSYQYKTVGGVPVQETTRNGDVRMKQNINELDSLLDDLNTAQKAGFSAENTSTVKKSTGGYDSALIEPIESSTPLKGGHVSRSVEKKVYQEQRYGSVGRQSPARDIYKQEHSYKYEPPSPIRQRKEVYKYESKTTRSTGESGREMSPPSSPPVRTSSAQSPPRQTHSVRSYNYTSSSDQDMPRTPIAQHRSPSPTNYRSPSPVGRSNKSYNYSSQRTHEYTDGGVYSQPQPPYRSPSPSSRRLHNYTSSTTTSHQDSYRPGPAPYRSPSPSPKTVHSYNYSSTTKESKQEVPRSPPPHRSPSPVSFIAPSMPSSTTTTVKTYNFDPSPRPQSPQPLQKFSPSDPSRTLNYQVSPPPNQPNIYSSTYKYSSHTSSSSKYPPPLEEHVPLLPRPFPTPSPTPDQQQQPPKKLDDLMASFSDTELQQHSYNESHRYTRQQPQQPAPREQYQEHQPIVTEPDSHSPSPQTPTTLQNNNNAEKIKSKNLSGPPVYYPPGVELFAKKEENAMQQQQIGGGKMAAKAKYEYKAKSKSKEKSSSGKTVVPVCLPVCCAMPCVIM